MLGVVEHIHQHAGIERTILVWDREAVELPHWNLAGRANEHVDPDHGKIRPSLSDEAGEQPVAAPNVENRRAGRKHLTEDLAQDPSSSRMNGP